MTEPEQLKSLEYFLFGAPLYKTFVLPNDLKIAKVMYDQMTGSTVDGHCPNCRRASTFSVQGTESFLTHWDEIKTLFAYEHLSIECVRDKTRIHYYFLIHNMKVQKIGQFPSLADISNDEVRQYRNGMDVADGREFHKAIGLAAHGVGVGSFVYLRRVFERLIYARYEEFKDVEGWKDDDFFKARMIDKIKLMKDHLPNFLVDNAKIYSILSIGIHDLDEQDCLGYFDLMKQSIIIILEDDKKKKEELALRNKFTQAISKIKPPTES